MTDQAEPPGRQAARRERERLIAAALELFPTEAPHAQSEASLAYRRLIQVGTVEELHSLLTTRMSLVMRHWRTHLDEQFKKRGETFARWRALFELSVNAPGETLTSIAGRVGVSKPTLIVILRELECDGLIVRTAGDGDRRAKPIAITDRGQQTVSSYFDLIVDVRTRFMAGIGRAETLILLDALDLMSANLRGMTSRGFCTAGRQRPCEKVIEPSLCSADPRR